MSIKQISTSPAQRVLLPAFGCRSVPERQPEPEDCQPDNSAAVIVCQKLKHKKFFAGPLTRLDRQMPVCP